MSDWSSGECSSDLSATAAETDRQGTGPGRPTKRKGTQRMSNAAIDIVIYHNPECGTSRNTLAMIRNAGIEPHVIEYLKTPPSRSMLVSLIERMGTGPRALLREKGTHFAELSLADRKSTRLNSRT